MKVLILTCSTGEGHNSTANALAEELKKKNIRFEIKNALDFVSKAKKDILTKGYNTICRYFPKATKIIYSWGELIQSTHALYREFIPYSYKVKRYIKWNKFDTVICCHVFAGIMVDGAKNLGCNIKQYFVNTDYSYTPASNLLSMDAFFIPKGLKKECINSGLKANKLIESGIPVRDECYKSINIKKFKNELNIDNELPLIVCASGSMGAGTMANIALSLKRHNKDNATIITLCGTNKEMYDRLIKHKNEFFIPLSFTKDAINIIKCANILITKPGGLSISETGTINVPLILIDEIPGLETYNLNFFVKNNMALKATNKEDAVSKVNYLLARPSEQNKLRKNQKKYFSSHPEKIIINTIIKKASK